MLQHGKLLTGKEVYQLPAGEIILCPHQPGNLKISKGACGKRHLHSQKSIFFERLLGNNPFVDGFSLCLNCSIGRRILREEGREKNRNGMDRGAQRIPGPKERPEDKCRASKFNRS